MPEVVLEKATCPNCDGGPFRPSGQVEHLGKILQRWTDEAGVAFSAQTLAAYADQPELTLHACEQCGFKSFLPLVPGADSFYSDISQDEQNYYLDDKWEFRRAIADIRRVGAQSVLDIGSGSGAFLARLRRALPDVDALGYEHNPRALEDLARRGFSTISGLKAADRLFDAICIFQVVEHVDDPFGLVQKAHGLLKRHGRLIITVPDNGGPVGLFHDALTELPPHHLSRWTRQALGVCVQRRGFQIERVRVEPLPAILWDAYVPAMLRAGLPSKVLGLMHKTGMWRIIISGLGLLKRLGVKHLPLHGHSLYLTAQKR